MKVSTKRNPSNDAAVSEDPGGKTFPFEGTASGTFLVGKPRLDHYLEGGESEVTRSRDWHKNIEGTKMANWDDEFQQQTKRNILKAGNKMKFVSFLSSKKWCVGWYCWLFLKIWCSFYSLSLFLARSMPISGKKLGANPSWQLQVDKISSSRGVFLLFRTRCTRLQRQENGWLFASALSWKLPYLTAETPEQLNSTFFCLLSAGVSFIFPCFTTFAGLFQTTTQGISKVNRGNSTHPKFNSESNRAEETWDSPVHPNTTADSLGLHHASWRLQNRVKTLKETWARGKKCRVIYKYICICILIYIYMYKLVGDWLRYMHT